MRPMFNLVVYDNRLHKKIICIKQTMGTMVSRASVLAYIAILMGI